ncbi:hypothetical protein GUITHDRAFT_115475 [Guillardia theta CCMP2712]|uniref:Uncharacterized protein n=1 Tax=Guillardia theta (strain CCMP2712) TaxID=905079 RepID=L1IPX4_GUITC|nr:hypothetical protein GUITHDRAFT_115475 [Guillardia theta CCMP2712]EKX38326.1 hypothetical protein GUITHDRAFT_115475 [Guillardia theta CCMP2712]|eukprot:XP_005825306.1 hypothetical protein GUITHDRAFT_115475 [Guillardia theta CCMP2712]
MVVSGANYTDGKKKRMGLTLALKNDQRVDPEDTRSGSRIVSWPRASCETEACSKKSDSDWGGKTCESFIKKLLLME